jgi:hypothetical protein
MRIYLARHRGRCIWLHIPDVLMLALPVLRPLRRIRLLVLIRMINRRATASLWGQVVAYVVASASLVLFCASLAVLMAERDNPDANIKSFGVEEQLGSALPYGPARRSGTRYKAGSCDARRSGASTPSARRRKPVLGSAGARRTRLSPACFRTPGRPRWPGRCGSAPMLVWIRR